MSTITRVATGGLSPGDVASPARAVFKHQKNLTVLMGELTRVDYAAKTVEIDHGFMELPYDYLVLAIGGRTSYFGNDHWEAHAPGMKNLPDALRIRNEVLYAFERAERSSDPPEEVVRDPEPELIAASPGREES